MQKKVEIAIDPESGFCFGVKNAVTKAINELADGQKLYSLGAMVHNPVEVNRLASIGLGVIDHEQFAKLHNAKVIFRAHGEPPSSYANLKDRNIKLIDATCPVVLRLQANIKKAYEQMRQCNGQVVIFGKKGHAEVIGLIGQTDGNAILIENEKDISKIDFSRPIEFFSQTTKDVSKFMNLVKILGQKSSQFQWHDTICRQVANRGPHLRNFASEHEVIIFVGGRDSSNAKVLFEICKSVNAKSYFIENESDIQNDWFTGVSSIGISGATSTPSWLIENVADRINAIVSGL
ncbi:MAG: 4-hydroxy-3-methylbut-2-enyl diphosphate reductase [Salinivirgaceae bacterium]|nr:4-hydroxy-3-methylbut-2-enyl diphosphate reductase [Salinivirgaceae bacterium]MBO7432870.1 4-hydroxy-3-methylbut-2-enyl diphosphate reductase [Salinivirgaceae bacterium]